MRSTLLISLLLLATACQAPAPAHDDHDHGHHKHQAPHGGALIVLGEEDAHLELVLDSESGTLTAYVLDSEAEQAIRLARPELIVEVEGKPLQLAAQASELSGEKVGDSSEFRSQSPLLIGLSRFQGSLPEIEVQGRRYEKITFKYPEGNE